MVIDGSHQPYPGLPAARWINPPVHTPTVLCAHLNPNNMLAQKSLRSLENEPLGMITWISVLQQRMLLPSSRLVLIASIISSFTYVHSTPSWKLLATHLEFEKQRTIIGEYTCIAESNVVALLSDGWTNIWKEHFVNFIVSIPQTSRTGCFIIDNN